MKRSIGKLVMAIGIVWMLAGLFLFILAYVSAYSFAHAPDPDHAIAVIALTVLFLLPGWILYRLGRKVSLGEPIITWKRQKR